ncbi:hypothetical protein CEXT_149481 [Caerostris extrusa]|uniref:Uncharacterized protein n=1 Tax=Caerostris extrusa TaxID=172846 RepID=A0AAV4XRE4_CAEEX|nr:hypothetical protein CEXT_149481 [Caerostris extrusa]
MTPMGDDCKTAILGIETQKCDSAVFWTVVFFYTPISIGVMLNIDAVLQSVHQENSVQFFWSKRLVKVLFHPASLSTEADTVPSLNVNPFFRMARQ